MSAPAVEEGLEAGQGRGVALNIFPTMSLFASYNFPKQCHQQGPSIEQAYAWTYNTHKYYTPYS